MSHVWNNYDPQGVFKDHRRDRYGQLVIGIVTRRPRIVFPTWEVRAISSETMNSWNSVRGFHGMPRVRRILGLRAIGGRRIFATTTSFDIISRKCLSFHHQSGNNTGTIFFNRYNRFKPIRLDIELLICNWEIFTNPLSSSRFKNELGFDWSNEWNGIVVNENH